MGIKMASLIRRFILIKKIISTLLIFQCSNLLAPTRIGNQIGRLIRIFFMPRGEENNKMLHMVSWNVITEPK